MSHEADEPSVHDSSLGNSPAGHVPVYNCHAILSACDADGRVSARCCNLPGIVARGKSQREALAALVAAFKAEVSRFAGAGQPIPWVESAARLESGEQERWIAVHL